MQFLILEHIICTHWLIYTSRPSRPSRPRRCGKPWNRGRWDGKTYPKIAGEWMFIDDFYLPLHCNPFFTKDIGLVWQGCHFRIFLVGNNRIFVVIGVLTLVPQRDRQGSTLVVLDVSSALQKMVKSHASAP